MEESEADRIIFVLEEAKRRSDDSDHEPFSFTTPEDLSLVNELIQSDRARGTITRDESRRMTAIALMGISVQGREYLARLKADRAANALPGILKKAAWAAGGFIVGLAATGFGAIFSRLAEKLIP